MLCLARRQFFLLQTANLLTPDMVAEFETLQRLVQEDPGAPEVSGMPGPACKVPLAPELSSDTSECHPSLLRAVQSGHSQMQVPAHLYLVWTPDTLHSALHLYTQGPRNTLVP